MEQKIVSGLVEYFLGEKDITAYFEKYLKDGWIIRSVSTTYVFKVKQKLDPKDGITTSDKSILYTLILEKE